MLKIGNKEEQVYGPPKHTADSRVTYPHIHVHPTGSRAPGPPASLGSVSMRGVWGDLPRSTCQVQGAGETETIDSLLTLPTRGIQSDLTIAILDAFMQQPWKASCHPAFRKSAQTGLASCGPRLSFLPVTSPSTLCHVSDGLPWHREKVLGTGRAPVFRLPSQNFPGSPPTVGHARPWKVCSPETLSDAPL